MCCLSVGEPGVWRDCVPIMVGYNGYMHTQSHLPNIIKHPQEGNQTFFWSRSTTKPACLGVFQIWKGLNTTKTFAFDAWIPEILDFGQSHRTEASVPWENPPALRWFPRPNSIFGFWGVPKKRSSIFHHDGCRPSWPSRSSRGRGVKRAQIGWPHGYEVEELHIYCVLAADGCSDFLFLETSWNMSF